MPNVHHESRQELRRASPAAFLAMAEGGARGFWAFGDRWVAHAGVVDDLVVRTGEEHEEGNAGRAAERARFRIVEERLKSAFAGRGSTGPARAFGGFAFSGLHRADGAWAAFPSARFHVPVVEMEFRAGGEGAWLVARDADPGRAVAIAECWAAAVEAGTPGEQAASEGAARALGALGEPEWASTPGRPVEAGSPGAPGWASGPEKAGSPSRPRAPSDPGGLAELGAPGGPGAGRTRDPGHIKLGEGMGRAAWDEMVGSALRRIRAGEAEKVVLARSVEAETDAAVGPAELALALWRENRGSYVFLFEPEPGHALAGAAPETIATLNGRAFRATAVAGSAGVGSDSVEAARLGQRLFNSAKDRAEHDFVVEDVVARLEALGCDVRRDVEPHILALAHIQHLETKIAAETAPGLSLLDALASLHPTPAVCGIPREVALGVLTESEMFDRGWYAGPVGWLDSEGRGVFVPALRSAALSAGRWRLFAGAGIVPGSDPAAEWEETEMKLRPVLRAIASAGRGADAAHGRGADAAAAVR